VLEDEDIRSIIVGIFDANRRLHRIAQDVRALREELFDDDAEEEEGR
jgi:hypothetical protein